MNVSPNSSLLVAQQVVKPRPEPVPASDAAAQDRRGSASVDRVEKPRDVVQRFDPAKDAPQESASASESRREEAPQREAPTAGASAPPRPGSFVDISV